MTAPWCMVSRPIPYPDRRRVYVEGYGYGQTQERVTQGDTVIGIGIALDSGDHQMFSPSQIVEPPAPVRTAEVIQFPVRMRLIEARQ